MAKLPQTKRLEEPRGKPEFIGKPVFKFLDEVLLDGIDRDWIVGIEWSKGTRLNGWNGCWVYALHNHHSRYGQKRLTKVGNNNGIFI